MRSERQTALLDRLLATCDRGEPERVVSADVDVDRYTSQARLDAERRVLFRTMPLAVGRASDVAAPGAFFTHDAAGVPLLVTRDRDARVRAMLNVCRHRGTRLVSEASGTAKAFVCPYHAWTYDLAGRLGHVPGEACFPGLARDDSALVELPCEVRHGFVWVLPTPRSALDVASWLGDFDDDLASFGLDEHVVFARRTTVRAANWKLVMEAFLEGYHVKTLHQRTLARFFRDDAVVDTSGAHVRTIGARKTLAELRATPRAQWDLRAHTTPFYNLFPNAVLVFHPETISHLALYPRGLGEVEFVHTMLAPGETSEEKRSAWQRTWELIDEQVFAREDLAICESIQSVIGSGANTKFQIGALEASIRFFHDRIDDALAHAV